MNRDQKLALYEKCIEAFPKIKMKGKRTAYTSVNGHMFSFLAVDAIMAIRLCKEDQRDFIATYSTEPVIQYGSTMKDYVDIPDKVLQETSLMSSYIQRSYEYISSLEPKSTKRKVK